MLFTVYFIFLASVKPWLRYRTDCIVAKGQNLKSHALTLTLVGPCLCRTCPRYSHTTCYIKFHDPRSIHSQVILFTGRKTDTHRHAGALYSPVQQILVTSVYIMA